MAVIEFAPQPIKAVLVMRRLTTRSLAIRLGMSEVVLGAVLNGRQPPTPKLRADLSKILGLPDHELFRDEAE